MTYTQDEFERTIGNLLKEIEITLIKKGEDYTNTDPLENFKVLASHGVEPTEVAMTLIGIKVNRLKNLLITKKKPNYESLQDTIKDLAAYAVLLQAIVAEPVSEAGVGH